MFEKIKAFIVKGRMVLTLLQNLVSDLRDIWAGLKTDIERLKSQKSKTKSKK